MRTFEQTIKDLENNTLIVEETSYKGYEPHTFLIEKVTIEDGNHPNIDHPIFNQSWAIDNTFIAFQLKVTNADNTKSSLHYEVYPLYTSKGKIVYYGSFETKEGETIAGTQLHDIVKACCSYSTEQFDKFIFEPFTLNLNTFKGMQFVMNAKEIKEGRFILETEKQKLKDVASLEEWKKNNNKSNDSKAEVMLDDELPF